MLHFDARTCVFICSQVSKGKFGLAIWNDSFFLSQVGVMDYSILVGVDERSLQLVVGIIDYIRPYSWDKQLEYVMKGEQTVVCVRVFLCVCCVLTQCVCVCVSASATPGIIAGTGKRPTVVSPNIYRDRFRQATWLYFVMSPSNNTVVLRPVDNGYDRSCDVAAMPMLVSYEE